MSSADGTSSQPAAAESFAPGQDALLGAEPALAASVADEAPHGIRRAALTGAVWIGVGFGAMYLLRLASGIITTRLVAPGVFGLLDLATVFIQGLHMFADIGLGLGVIQSRRGDDPDFLNTAWTLQILRGLALWAATGLIGYAVAAFYGQPLLLVVIPVLGATAAIDGFNSMALFTLTRRLVRGPLVALEVGVQTTGLAVTVAWMLCVRADIWGFVVGSLVTSLLNMALTHLALAGGRSRFRWEPAAARELFRFGKWVLVGTMVTFLAFQAERLIVSKAGGPALMGVFGRALALAGLATGLMSTFATQLILPVYSRMHQSGREIRTTFRAVHGSAAGFAAFLVTGLFAAGPAAVHSLYGSAFHEAGWMLRFVAAGAWFQMLEGTIGASLLTLGQPRAVTAGNASRLVGVLAFVPAGYVLGEWAGLGGPLGGGFVGMLLGFVAADVLRYFVVVWLARRNGMSAVGTDAALTLLVAALGPAAAFAGDSAVGLFDAHLAHPRAQAVALFLCQGALVVLAWGLVYALWLRKHLRPRAA